MVLSLAVCCDDRLRSVLNVLLKTTFISLASLVDMASSIFAARGEMASSLKLYSPEHSTGEDCLPTLKKNEGNKRREKPLFFRLHFQHSTSTEKLKDEVEDDG